MQAENPISLPTKITTDQEVQEHGERNCRTFFSVSILPLVFYYNPQQ